MAEHKHGEMNTSIQEKTFDGFMKWTTWSVIIILAVIILMAMFITCRITRYRGGYHAGMV
mgnify:CR=1 FL=1